MMFSDVKQVFAERLHHNIKPQRNPLHRNFLSDSDYTMDILPPFVAGNFIVMSSDLVAFVAKNFDDFLQPIGSLEDVTLAVWFQAMKVFLFVLLRALLFCMLINFIMRCFLYTFLESLRWGTQVIYRLRSSVP